MSIIYCIFLYILAIRIFVRDMTRKNCFIAISIVTALMLLSDITTIISAGILTYLKYQGWQIILAYVLGILWIFNGSISLRRMKFKHNFKQKESAIKTANGRKITYAILTALMLIIGSACLVLYLNKKILTTISFIAPYIIAVLLIILLIKTMLSLNEEKQQEVLREVLKKKLTVADTERLIKKEPKPKKKKASADVKKTISRNVKIALNTLQQAIGMIEKTGTSLQQETEDLEDEYVITIRIHK